jgi:hypothetical protein
MSNKNPADERYPDYENLLNDLYSLQKNLLVDEVAPAESSAPLPPSISDEDMHHLEIPILSEVVDSEIYEEQLLKEKFNSVQQHLFDQPSSQQPSPPQPPTDEQINGVVDKLMARMRPKFEQLLRDKIHSLVVERFNREN